MTDSVSRFMDLLSRKFSVKPLHYVTGCALFESHAHYFLAFDMKRESDSSKRDGPERCRVQRHQWDYLRPESGDEQLALFHGDRGLWTSFSFVLAHI